MHSMCQNCPSEAAETGGTQGRGDGRLGVACPSREERRARADLLRLVRGLVRCYRGRVGRRSGRAAKARGLKTIRRGQKARGMFLLIIRLLYKYFTVGII